MKANKDIRRKAFEMDIKFWEIAKWLGITPETFSKLLRDEFSEQLKAKVMNAIDEIAGNGNRH